MADSKMAVSQWRPDFVQDLLPAAEKTALLYHLSYLCLANFPNLERIIRSRAVETQLLFGSSDAVMLKCILTSKNLVELLFPMLVTAVERHDADLAVSYLGKARVWIKDIMRGVDLIVEKYDLHNRDVASSTSDVIKEKQETDQKIQEQARELKQTLDDLNSKLQKTTEKLEEIEKQINRKTQEIQEFDSRSTSKTIEDVLLNPAHYIPPSRDPDPHRKALEEDLKRLFAYQFSLTKQQSKIQQDIIDCQRKEAKARFDLKSIPDPVYLDEVPRSLKNIQDILIQLRNFWESFDEMLDYLEQNTSAGEDHEDFRESIDTAKQALECFGEGCQKASVIFKLQTKDAYKFLEVNPSSLSEVEWQRKFESVKKRLENIDQPQPVTSSGTPAISE